MRAENQTEMLDLAYHHLEASIVALRLTDYGDWAFVTELEEELNFIGRKLAERERRR